jgi:hypothetical protein
MVTIDCFFWVARRCRLLKSQQRCFEALLCFGTWETRRGLGGLNSRGENGSCKRILGKEAAAGGSLQEKKLVECAGYCLTA